MSMTDIQPLEKWEELEKELHERFGVNAAAADEKGVRITKYAAWANTLCPKIKGDPKGLSGICAVIGQYCTGELQATKKTVIEECDAGLVKITVPVLSGGEVVGNIGGCGLISEDGEVDTFMVAKALEVEESEIVPLVDSVPVMTKDTLNEMLDFIGKKLSVLTH